MVGGPAGDGAEACEAWRITRNGATATPARSNKNMIDVLALVLTEFDIFSTVGNIAFIGQKEMLAQCGRWPQPKKKILNAEATEVQRVV